MLILANLTFSLMAIIDGETWVLFNPGECYQMYGRESTKVKFELWLSAIHLE